MDTKNATNLPKLPPVPACGPKPPAHFIGALYTHQQMEEYGRACAEVAAMAVFSQMEARIKELDAQVQEAGCMAARHAAALAAATAAQPAPDAELTEWVRKHVGRGAALVTRLYNEAPSVSHAVAAGKWIQVASQVLLAGVALPPSGTVSTAGEALRQAAQALREATGARVEAAATAAQPDTARLDWLEAWHDCEPKAEADKGLPGYGDTGMALITRTSDGWLIDGELPGAGGTEHDTLRDAIDAAKG